MIAFTIYSRAGCHLCDEMKAVVERVASSTTPAASIDVIDISSDPDLESRYGLEIPVLMVNGKKAAKYRVSEEELARMVDARVERAGEAG
jgi:hypothetical protein